MGDKYAAGDHGPPVTLVHRGCGHEMEGRLDCDKKHRGEPVTARDVTPVLHDDVLQRSAERLTPRRPADAARLALGVAALRRRRRSRAAAVGRVGRRRWDDQRRRQSSASRASASSRLRACLRGSWATAVARGPRRASGACAGRR